ncbi:MAG: hypothetical protein Q9162_007478 [Coniocarpon cinnabarinum]
MIADVEYRFKHSVAGLGNLAREIGRTAPAEDDPPFEYTDRGLAILCRVHEVHSKAMKERMEQEFLLQRSHVSSEVRGLEERLDTRFRWVDKRFDVFEKSVDKRFEEFQKDMDKRFHAVDVRFDKLEKSVDVRFNELEKKMDARFLTFERKMDERFHAVDRRFKKIEGEMHDIKGHITNSTAIAANRHLRRMHKPINVVKVRQPTADPNEFVYTAHGSFPKNVKSIYALGQTAKGVRGLERLTKQYGDLTMASAQEHLTDLLDFYGVTVYTDDASESDATEVGFETSADSYLEDLLDKWGMDWEQICALGDRHMAEEPASQAGMKRVGVAEGAIEKRARV